MVMIFQTVELALQTRVCHNAVAVGIRKTIPPAGKTQTESKPDEIDTRRTPYPTVVNNRIEVERP
jgi:hypothetical protein